VIVEMMVQLALREISDSWDSKETKDSEDLRVLVESQDTKEDQDKRLTLELMEIQVHLDNQESVDQWDQLERKESVETRDLKDSRAKMAYPDHQDHQESQDNQDLLSRHHGLEVISLSVHQRDQEKRPQKEMEMKRKRGPQVT